MNENECLEVLIAELRRLAEMLEFPPDRVKLICRADELEAELP